MTDREMKKTAAYLATMNLVKQMLEKGVISESGYGEIDKIIAGKYGLSLSVIFRVRP